MIAAVADTHTVIWYLASDKRLSPAARSFIEEAFQQGNTIAVSSITFVEMVYLVEKGRIPAESFDNLIDQLQVAGVGFVEIPVDLRITQAMRQVDPAQIPDMPDRIVAATAVALTVPIISRDGKINASSIDTVW